MGHIPQEPRDVTLLSKLFDLSYGSGDLGRQRDCQGLLPTVTHVEIREERVIGYI